MDTGGVDEYKIFIGKFKTVFGGHGVFDREFSSLNGRKPLQRPPPEGGPLEFFEIYLTCMGRTLGCRILKSDLYLFAFRPTNSKWTSFLGWFDASKYKIGNLDQVNMDLIEHAKISSPTLEKDAVKRGKLLLSKSSLRNAVTRGSPVAMSTSDFSLVSVVKQPSNVDFENVGTVSRAFCTMDIVDQLIMKDEASSSQLHVTPLISPPERFANKLGILAPHLFEIHTTCYSAHPRAHRLAEFHPHQNQNKLLEKLKVNGWPSAPSCKCRKKQDAEDRVWHDNDDDLYYEGDSDSDLESDEKFMSINEKVEGGCWKTPESPMVGAEKEGFGSEKEDGDRECLKIPLSLCAKNEHGAPFKGLPVFELYKTILRRNRDTDLQADIINLECGKNIIALLPLSGPNPRPPLCEDNFLNLDFTIQICGQDIFSVGHEHEDSSLFPAWADVEVRLLDYRGGGRVSGLIVARSCIFYSRIRLLTVERPDEKKKGVMIRRGGGDEQGQVGSDGKIKLMRSVVTIPSYSSLIIGALLYEGDGGGRICRGKTCFPAKEKGKESKLIVYNGRPTLEVSVKWKCRV
ncbi:lipid A palmitoyltransferase PagP [Striga asiatica]|uniref:Lipid A palmitoyltransferase PagP n=1 Tax=Striga asiatica TaxID=4170 RepID=A0A5A7R944_STRAF|nr:lipid A palmitoyltransferase PagP [Striga asiatica]